MTAALIKAHNTLFKLALKAYMRNSRPRTIAKAYERNVNNSAKMVNNFLL